MKKKLISLALALVMVLCLVPMSAMALEEGETLAGKIEQLTPTMSTTKTEDKTVGGKTAQEVFVTVAPDANEPVPYSPAVSGQHTAGWWVGVKVFAPEFTGYNVENVKFRNNGDTADRAWAGSRDGKTEEGAEADYMQAWAGYEDSWFEENGDAKYSGTEPVWYFNWDGNEDTGITIAGSEFTSTGAAEMKGVDQIVHVSFLIRDKDSKESKVLLLDTDNKTIKYPRANLSEAVTNGDYTGKDAELKNAVTAAAASEDATVTVKAGNDGTTLPAAVFTAAAGTDNVALTVESGEVSVTLDNGALGVVAGQASEGSVTITAKDVKDDSSVGADKKPEGAVAAYEVKVTVSGQTDAISEWGQESSITLTVPVPTDAEGNKIDEKNLLVYLDGDPQPTIRPEKDGENSIKVTVPHLSVVALADVSDAVATDGTAYYSTVEEAFTGVTANGKITLLGNATASATLKPTKTFTLDLNGNKLSGTGSYTIQVDKPHVLTIIDSSTGTPGEVDNEHATASAVRANTGTLIFGGEDGSDSNFVIQNSGQKTTNQNSAVKVDEEGTVTFNGGTFKGPETPEGNYRSVQTFGTTTINGGTFDGEIQVWTWQQNGETYPSKTIINDGKFKDTVAICSTSTADASYPFEGTLEIKGGTFTNESKDQDGYNLGIQIPTGREEEAAASEKLSVKVSGGTFPIQVNPDYLDRTVVNFEVEKDGTYSYCATEDEAAALAGENGTVTNLNGGELTITPPGTVTGGSVTVADSAAAGATVTITLTPDSGYSVGAVTVKDADDNEVAVTKVNDTTYTFTMPAKAVTVAAAFKKEIKAKFTPSTGLTDTDTQKFFYGKLELQGLESGKYYLVAFDNGNAVPTTGTNGKTVYPRTCLVVQGETGDLSMICQKGMRVSVYDLHEGTDGAEYVIPEGFEEADAHGLDVATNVATLVDSLTDFTTLQ